MSTPRINRCWRLARRPETMIDEQTFELVEEPAPEPGPGEFLVRTCFLSLAPVMRSYVIDGGVIEKPLEIGATMMGRGVGVVVASRHGRFAEGDIVHGPFGWQDYAISDGTGRVYVMRHRAGSISSALGVLGLTGLTAYFGFFDEGAPRAGDQVLVSGAVGGVGSVVGQLAALAGCRAVAIAGSPEKCALATDRLGYAQAINYRDANVADAVARAFPDGLDIMFDNVGGAILDAGLANLAQRARVVLCGAISQYLNEDGSKRGPSNYFDLVYANASMRGFHIYAYRERYEEAEARMAAWIRDGRLVGLEDRLEGLEIMPRALMRLFEGANVGKQVVKIAPEPGEPGAPT